ncbi:MAG: GNAT family N-acetyltransferase [Oscillospiraceae bacterium]|jgi:RimJ/RimL family protein N-acetyltransferase|nr:GNAT family N-acetyltransferase [Oscillospiraceae bacterium]
MKIETARLCLFPLTASQLKRAIRNAPRVAADMGLLLGPCGFWVRHKQRKMYRAKYLIMKISPQAWLVTTIWFICDKQTSAVVGEAGFKGPPSMGRLEIGYATRREYRSRGYMTEAVDALCRAAWAFPGYAVTSVAARTLPGNTASHRVLQKNGFERDGVSGKCWKWIKTPPPE